MALFRKSTEVDKRRPLKSLHSRIMSHSGVSNLSAGRIALGYAVIAILWIAFSDAVVTHFKLHPAVMTIKGTIFVFVTASLLYFAIRRLVRAVQLTSQERDETAKLYRTVVEASNEGICLLDESERISFLNGRLAAMLGRSAEELQGNRLQDFIEETHVLAQRGAQKSETYECRLRTDSDLKLWVVISRHPVLNDAGEVVQWVCTAIDITERKRAEEALRERAEEALRRLNRELRAISNCNQTLLRATDEQSLLDKICRIVCEEAGYRMAWVAYAEHDEGKSVRPVAWTGAEEGYLASAGISWADTERGRGPTGTAIRSGKSCCVQDLVTDPRMAPWRDSVLQRGLRSSIALPLKDENDNAFGSLTIHSAQPNAFTSEEIRFLEELAGDMAFGIVTLRSRAARKQAEQKVALLGFALDNVREAALLIDDSAHIHYVNEEACRALSCSREALLGMAVPDIDSEFPEGRWSDHWRDLKAQRSMSFESRHRTRDGRVFPVEISANYFEYGGRAYNLALVRDITERKRAEDALRQSEAYLAEAQRLSHTGSWAWDMASDKYLYVSEEDSRIWGLDPQEGPPAREAVFRRIVPEDRNRVEQSFQKSLREKADTVDEYRIVLPDGTIKHIHTIRHPVLNDAGEIVKFVGTSIDITERKCAEEALRRSEAYLADAQTMTHTGSWALDAATREYTYWSEEMFRIFGVDPREGVPPREAMGRRIHPEDRNMATGGFEKALREKVDTSDEYRFVLPDGTLEHIHMIRHQVLNDAGGIVELVGTAVDVTERKRAEQERERLRQLEEDLAHINRVSMMGELAASIAHEVNQPLSGVVSNGSACLRWLAGDAPNLEEARETARRIVRDGKRAAEVITRIRALTKRTSAIREELDLNETVREVLALVGDEAKRNSVTIRTQFAKEVLPVLGDRVQLQQAALNLVMNAFEAMSSVGERPRELVITTQNIDPDQVQVTVEDSGTGLDLDAMKRIFEPFYTTKPGGMGMGLSICRSILDAHGGRLWATAKDGPGTMFHFTLPKYQEPESHAGAAGT